MSGEKQLVILGHKPRLSVCLTKRPVKMLFVYSSQFAFPCFTTGLVGFKNRQVDKNLEKCERLVKGFKSISFAGAVHWSIVKLVMDLRSHILP